MTRRAFLERCAGEGHLYQPTTCRSRDLAMLPEQGPHSFGFLATGSGTA